MQNQQSILTRLIKEVNDIKSALRRVVGNLPLYDIANENTPDAVSTDQDNYIPGNYDILRINATANITISGIRQGVKGRFLEILNVGTGRITYTDGNTGSDPENRFNLPYDSNVTQLPNARVRFYYDSTQQRWTLSDAPNIQGPFGKVAIVSNSVDLVVTVPKEVFTTIIPDTVETDEWGYWNPSNGRFTALSGDGGLFSLTISCYWLSSIVEAWIGYVLIFTNTQTIGQLYFPLSSESYRSILATVNFFLEPGEYVYAQAYQTSSFSTSRDIKTVAIGSPIFTFIRIG